LVHPLAGAILALKLAFRAPYVVYASGDKDSADLIANTFVLPKYLIRSDVNPEVYDPIVYDQNVIFVGLWLANPYVKKWFPALTADFDAKTISGYPEVSPDGKYILKGINKTYSGGPSTLAILVGGFAAEDTWRAATELVSVTPSPPGLWPWPLDAVQTFFEDLANNLRLGTNSLSSILGTIKAKIDETVLPQIGSLSDLIGIIKGGVQNDVLPGIGGLSSILDIIKSKIDTDVIPGIGGLPGLIEIIKDKIDVDVLPSVSGLSGLIQIIKDRIESEIGPKIGDISTGIIGLPSLIGVMFDGAANSITQALPGMGNWILNPLMKIFSDTLSKAQGEDSPKAFSSMTASFPSPSELLASHSPLTPEESYTEMDTLRASFDQNYKDVYYAVLTIEAISGGQIETPGLGLLGYLNFTGAADLHKTIKTMPYTHGYIKYLEYYWNKVFSPELPGPRDIANMWSKGWLEPTLATEGIAYQGWPAEYITAFLNASYEVPGILDLYSMLWRGLIDKTKIASYLRQLGYHQLHIDNLIALSERIPGPDDLIRFGVREAYIKPEWDIELAEEFITYMRMQGYSDIWTRYFWRAHWVLVPLGQLYDMFHRGLIDAAELSTQIRYHDYLPEWRDKLIALSWDLPGRIDLRWMFRWGKIDFGELTELLQKTGIDPAYVDRVAEAYAKNQFLTELNKLRDDKKAAFIEGFIDEDTLRADLEGLGYAKEFIDFMVQDAIEDRDLKHKRALLDIYEDSYLNDIATEPPFEELVRKVKVDKTSADLFIDMAYVKKYRKAKV